MATSQTRQRAQFQAGLQPYRDMFRGSSDMYVQAARGLYDFEMNHRHLWGQFYRTFDALLRAENIGITAETYRKYVQFFNGEFAGIHPEIFAISGVHGANQIVSLTAEEQEELLGCIHEYSATYHHQPFYQWVVARANRIRNRNRSPRTAEVYALIHEIQVCLRRLNRGEVSPRTIARVVTPHLRAARNALTDLLAANNLNAELPSRNC